MIIKKTRSTLNTSSVLDHILIKMKECVTKHSVIKFGISDHDLIFYTWKMKSFKPSKYNTILVTTYKNYSKKLLEERLTKTKLWNYFDGK